jgi:hypothetical protein
MFRIFILDNGLDKLSGHHFNQALGLIKGAQQLGYRPSIFSAAASSSVPEIVSIARPTFQKFLYRPNPFVQIRENALIFAQECNQCLPPLDGSDILFFPNANYDEIASIAYLIEKRRIKEKIVVRLLYYPHEHEKEYFECLGSLQSFPNVKLVTSSVPYSNWLTTAGFPNTYIGGPPHNLPYDLINEVQPQYEFAYLGQAAKAKGFELLLSALILGAREGYKPKTLLHTKGYTIAPELLSHLDHVTIISDAVSEEVFYKQLGATKCIVTYYHPGNYKLQDSAIVTEALALERYVLCSPIAFIAETYGNDFFQFSCTAGEYNEHALLNKMRAISAQVNKPDFVLAASQKAKLLSSPNLFVAKVLSA